MLAKHRSITAALAAPLAIAAVVLACSKDSTGPDLSGLPSCGPATLLTTTPIALADIREIGPLGNLNPPGHTFPSDHIYFYPTIGPGVPVASPGKVRVTQVLLQKRTGGGQPEFDDYGMDFYPCPNQHFYFGHVSTLTASLLAKVGALDGSCDQPYQTGGFTFVQCRKTVKVDLADAEAIVTAGGPGQGALDLGLVDMDMAPLAYVDPGRQTGAGGVHAACPVDYFVTSVRDSLRARMAVNGIHRVIAPVCGSVMQDVANTAQGRWFFDATTNEDHHLGLVHQNWDPTIGAFSIGTSIPATASTVLMFTPAAAGRVNRDFNLVSADGNIYCYQLTNSSGHVFVQLTGATQLKIEVFGTGATCGDSTTWSFGANAATFAR